MRASRDEVIDLLSKWLNEHTPVTALLGAPGTHFAVKVSGFVNGITSDLLISDGPHDSRDKPENYLLIPILGIQEYQYVEIKDLNLEEEQRRFLATGHGMAGVSLVFADGSRLSLFERNLSDES